jgi:hypothetical protein
MSAGHQRFTLIRVTRESDRRFHPHRRRKASAAGGDNLDLTLAWLVESKLGNASSAAAARYAGSAPRRRNFFPTRSQGVEITVLGGGSSLVGGTLKTKSRAKRFWNWPWTDSCRSAADR